MSLVYFEQIRVHIIIPQVGTVFLAGFTVKFPDDAINKGQIKCLNLVFDILCGVTLNGIGVEIGRTMLINVILAVKLIDAFLLPTGSVMQVDGSELGALHLFAGFGSHDEILFGHWLSNVT